MREFVQKTTLRAATCVAVTATVIFMTVTGQLSPEFVAGAFVGLMTNLWPRNEVTEVVKDA